MNVRNTLSAIIDYYMSARGVGHTKAVVHGAANADAMVVVGSAAHAKDMSTRMSLNRRRLILLDNLTEELHGLRRPLVFDNLSLVALLIAAREHIIGVEEQAVELGEKVKTLEAELKMFRADQAAKVPRNAK